MAFIGCRGVWVILICSTDYDHQGAKAYYEDYPQSAKETINNDGSCPT